ncbi:MAG: HypC/HybG/HupF family hydrogenase formation chaperone [Polyangia bacterium]
MATPLEVLAVGEGTARVASAGVELDVATDLIEELEVGDYLIVHAGYAIQRLEPEEAAETLAVLQRLEESWRQ